MELFKRGSFKGSFSIGATQRMSLRWGNSRGDIQRGSLTGVIRCKFCCRDENMTASKRT